MFNFNKGIPIARITKGDGTTEILFLDDSAGANAPAIIAELNKKPAYLRNAQCEYCKKVFYGPKEVKRHQVSSCKVKQFKDYNEFLDRQKKPKQVTFEDEYEEYSDNSPGEEEIFELMPEATETGSELILDEDSTLQVLPRKEREVIYAGGKSGSGKTYFCAQYIKEFTKIFPKRPIFVFSRIKEDKSLDNLKNLKKIPLTEKLLDDKIQLDDLKDSLVMFDDVENSSNKKIQNYCKELLDEILENGRDHKGNGKDDIYCICTHHKITSANDTASQLNECHGFVCFPKMGSRHGIQRALKEYITLNQKQIDKIMKLPSRWVYVYNHAPCYVLYEKGGYILS